MKMHRRVTGADGESISNLCGIDGISTYDSSRVTCRRCLFSILADSHPWAREFLDNLRKPNNSLDIAQLLNDCRVMVGRLANDDEIECGAIGLLVERIKTALDNQVWKV